MTPGMEKDAETALMATLKEIQIGCTSLVVQLRSVGNDLVKEHVQALARLVSGVASVVLEHERRLADMPKVEIG